MATPYNILAEYFEFQCGKTPTYGHLLLDILQWIAKRNALLQVAGESVNPLI